MDGVELTFHGLSNTSGAVVSDGGLFDANDDAVARLAYRVGGARPRLVAAKDLRERFGRPDLLTRFWQGKRLSAE